MGVDYSKILEIWNSGLDDIGIEWLQTRGITVEAANYCKLANDGALIIFPYGLNGRMPERFKIIDMSAPKKHSMFFSNRSPMVEDEHPLCMFNQQNFKDRSRVVITEGEWDCLSWISKGFYNVMSVPNGASGASQSIKNAFSYINRFQEIFINFDNDDPGIQAFKDIEKIIPEYKLRNITLPMGVKDMNEFITSVPVVDGDIETLLRDAFRPVFSTVVHVGSIDFESIFTATATGINTGYPHLDRILGGIRPYELTALTGDTASGKTTFAMNIAKRFADKKHGVWIASQEMRPAKLLEKIGSIVTRRSIRSHQIDPEAKGYLREWLQSATIFIDPHGASMTLQTVLDGIDFAHYVHQVKLVIIEDLGYIASTVSVGEERQNIEFIMQQLHAKALQTGVHIMLIVHPTQSQDDRGFMDMAKMKGSSGIKQYCDNVMIIQRLDRAFPKQEDLHKYTSLRVTKNRALGTEGQIALEYEHDYDGFSHSDKLL
jgi:archaellum biogenesis ATPase FlaH